MSIALTEQTLGSLACLIPGATRVFRQYKLDFCCGGNTPLRDAALQRNLDAQAIAEQLAALDSATPSEPDWRNEPAAAQIEFLLER